MNRILSSLLVGILALMLHSCNANFIQIFETNAVGLKKENENWVYENDTVRIVYGFWYKSGILSFSILNKLNVPIYIDWRKSAFIYNGNKLNYWIDEEVSSSMAYYRSYTYKGPLIKPGYTLNSGLSVAQTTTYRPEQSTFIPPQSLLYRSQFLLFPDDYYPINPIAAETSLEPNPNNPSKLEVVYRQNFLYGNTPVKFRNYIAISITEKSEDITFVDNVFFVTSIVEMKYSHFLGKIISNNQGNIIYAMDLKNESSFYKRLGSSYSTQQRVLNAW